MKVVLISILLLIFSVGCTGEVKQTTDTNIPTITENPIITEAPHTDKPSSFTREQQIFYETVEEEDKCNEKFEMTFDPKDLPGPECGEEARIRVAEKYGITMEELKEIGVRGIMEGWEMPPL